jgi:hypothetical protein
MHGRATNMVYNKKMGKFKRYNTAYTQPTSFFLKGEEGVMTVLFKPVQSPSSNVPEVQVRGVQEEGGTPMQRKINVSGPEGSNLPNEMVAARRAAVVFAEKMAPHWWIFFSYAWYIASFYGLREGI